MPETLIDTTIRIWQNLGVVAVSGARILGIVLIAFLAIRLAHRALLVVRTRIAARLDDPESLKRGETLNRVFRYLVTVVVSLIAVVAVLSELGVAVAPILGAAGVVGLAVGFGAQSLVKDYVTGLFLLIENQIRQGDVVQLGEFSGSVEEVTLRYVRLRDYNGSVYFIPNGTISAVINMSSGFAHAVIDIGVGQDADLDRVMGLMRQVAATLRADPAFSGLIQQDLEIAGVQDWTPAAVMIRARFQVVASQQWAVRREYLLRLKRAFDAHGIDMPVQQVTLLRSPAPLQASLSPAEADAAGSPGGSAVDGR